MRRRRSWFGLAFGLLSQACTSQGVPARKPSVELVPPKLDLGGLVQNQAAQASVELRNPGAISLRLTSTASSTRCRWQGLPDGLGPGAKAPLSVICQSDLLGPLQEQLLILEGAQVIATLSVVGKVDPIVGFDTAFVDLRPEFGQGQFVDVHLIGPRAHQTRAKLTSTGGDMVSVVPLDADAGRPSGFRVSCQGNRVGMHAGSLVVATGLSEPSTLTLSWGCRVPATLQVEPSTPYFNLHLSGDRATTITVRSSQRGFAIRSARINEGPFTATLESPNPDGSIPITIRVKNREIPDDARAASGKLLIQSNDAREPSKEVPLFGFGKINKISPSP